MARTRATVIGALALLLLVVSFTSGAMIGETWRASDVVPVVLVKPGIAGFEPVEGTSIGNRWSKSEVKPVVLLKPGINGYAPREGFSMDVWTKQNVLPVVLVEPSGGGFAPMSELSSDSSTPLATAPPANSSLPITMESEVDGDFEGWSGETIVKLTDGHIWQQRAVRAGCGHAVRVRLWIFFPKL